MPYLLERLAQDPAAGAATREGFDLREAVRSQIQRVVSTHVWPGATGLELMGIGLPQLNGFGYAQKDDIARYAGLIREQVVRHEPRLLGVSVMLQSLPSAAMPYKVLVSGRLADQAQAERFQFELPRN
jgi:predicted component of type VI protein secretion system